MTVSAPAVSVVMPAYNASEHVGEAVRSILEQTHEDFELILIDDGSTDDTVEKARDAAAGDRRLVVLSQANTGITGALNRGLDAARGPWVARMDADDLANPRRLEAQLATLTRRPTLVVLGCWATTFSDTGAAGPLLRPPAAERRMRRLLRRVCPLIHPSVMLRRDAVRAVGGYRSEYLHAEDYDLWLRLAEVGAIGNVPEALISLRLHGGQVSGRQVEQQAVASLGARVAAQRRRRGHADPTRPGETVTVEVLRRWGVRPASIAAAIEMAWVRRLGRDASAAPEAITSLEPYGPRRARRVVAAGLCIATARAAARDRRPAAAISACRAVVRSPSIVLRLLADKRP